MTPNILKMADFIASDSTPKKKTVERVFCRKIRIVISYHLALTADGVFEGSVELDESYFGGRRKGRRGHCAAGEVVVFDILKHNGRVLPL